jgi:hypothetical protein
MPAVRLCFEAIIQCHTSMSQSRHASQRRQEEWRHKGFKVKAMPSLRQYACGKDLRLRASDVKPPRCRTENRAVSLQSTPSPGADLLNYLKKTEERRITSLAE